MLSAFRNDLRLLSEYRQLFPLCFAVFISMMGFGLVMPLLPIYARRFGASGTELGFLTGSFAIARVFTTFPGGWLADRAGRKTPVVAGLFAYSIVMTLYGFSQDVGHLILLRGLQGAASGIVWPIISTMVADITLPKDRGKAMGLYEMMWFSGMVVGPGLGGVLAALFSDSAPFFVCGVLALASMLLVVFIVSETFKAESEAEELQRTLQAGSGSDVTNRVTTGFFGGMTPYPVVFVGLCIAGFVVSFSSSLIQPVLSVFAEERLAISELGVGLLFSAMAAVTLVTTLPISTLADRTGRKSMFIVGKVIDAISAILILLSGGFWFLLCAMMFRGLGRAASNPSITAMFTSIVPAFRRGRGMGIFNGFRNVGLVLGSTVGGILWDAASPESPFIACAVVNLVGVAVALFTVSEPKRGLE